MQRPAHGQTGGENGADAKDRMGIRLPDTPTSDDIDRLADRLRRISESEFAHGTFTRLSDEDLEQRRRRAVGG